MRFPTPAALLIEHPAVPVPGIEAHATESEPVGEVVDRKTLTRSDRYQLAAQLTAAVSLLAEFDLWPGRTAIKSARIWRSSDGIGTTLSRFPVPLSQVFTRLGSGQTAAETTRRAVMEAVSCAVGLPISAIDVDRDEPGFFLEGAIVRQLRELPTPLDRVTARSLWALRWDGLPAPEPGVASYWHVSDEDLARRYASALWATLGRKGREAWMWPAGREDLGTAPSPALGGKGVLIVVGSISSDELAAISRWAQRPGCSAVAVGSFPRGWYPPEPPGIDDGSLSRHLAVTGTTPDRSRKVIDQRAGRFDPLDRRDREALTRLARYRFKDPPLIEIGARARSAAERLEEMLHLVPEGLPPGFVAVHSGLSAGEIDDALKDLAVIETLDRWRLPDVRPLEPGAAHLEIAGLFESGDPRRRLHSALGSGDATELVKWSRRQLDVLDGRSVRDLLAPVAPGCLGPVVQSLMAEACLSILDLTGARAAIGIMNGPRRRVLERWFACLDEAPSSHHEMPSDEELEIEPRVAAEVAIRVLAQSVHGRGGDLKAVRNCIDGLLPRLSEALRGRIEIERTFIDDPARFKDREWRRRVAAGHPVLRALVIHRFAYLLADAEPHKARRLFRNLRGDEIGPGLSAVLELDIGMTEIVGGESRIAEVHQLRAYRLLQAAGFQHATRAVLFNLAVTDLDQLRVGRASDRLSALAEDEPESPYLLGEMCRLALALGDESEFRRSLSLMTADVSADLPPFAEGVAFLRGVSLLLDGDLASARRELARGGQEGGVWLELVHGLSGRVAEPQTTDGWGVTLAAAWLGRGLPSFEKTTMSDQEGFALALVDRLAGTTMEIEPTARALAVRVLDSLGIHGWAEQLRGSFGGSVVPALAKIVERGSFEGIGEDNLAGLLQALGLTGLEIIDTREGRQIWRIGTGAAGSEVRHGRISLVPLGGEASGEPAWILVKTLFELFAPPSVDHQDPSVEKTGFVGSSPPAVLVRRQLLELGPSHLPILILGETGVGKEVAAKALHRLSGRDGALVAVDMNAIPANLLEAELFGSLKGAFTGADRARRGLVMAADGGTLFLDEIGDLDPLLQVKLLRFLESKEVRPVGSDHATKVDVRIVAATHRDLKQRIRENVFRSDLFYRLAITEIKIPPLRERHTDIPALTEHFESLAVARHGLLSARWSAEAMKLLQRYRWPGNVREFRQTIEVALVRAAGGPVRAEHLPIENFEEMESKPWDVAQREFRARFLEAALRRNNGNRSATARELGISRQALLYHLRNLGLTHILKN